MTANMLVRTPTAIDEVSRAEGGGVSEHDFESSAPHTPSHTPQEKPHHPLALPFDLHTFTKHLHRHGQADKVHSNGRHKPLGIHMRLRSYERIRHFTFVWYTLVMATAGLAHIIYHVPFKFHGLYAIGCTFFILSLVFFIFNCTMICLRFCSWPSTLKGSFLHPTESLFIPAFTISLASIMINIAEYGLGSGETGLWLLSTLTVLFWIYVVLAIGTSLGIYLTMWSTQSFSLANMTPIWIFPAYPMLLVGPLASALSSTQGAQGTAALDMIIGGFICQGAGFMVSLTIYAAFIYRLMAHKLPHENARPGMFTSVGPAAFTTSSVISMATHFQGVVPEGFMGNGEVAGQVTKVLGIWAGLWLFGLAVWFFFVSLLAHWSCLKKGHRLTFAMTWYSWIFPQTALTKAVFDVSLALNRLRPLQVIGCVMTVTLVVVWLFVVSMNIRAVILKQILWPERQEDSQRHIRKRPSGPGELDTTASSGHPLSRLASFVGTPSRLHHRYESHLPRYAAGSGR